MQWLPRWALVLILASPGLRAENGKFKLPSFFGLYHLSETERSAYKDEAKKLAGQFFLHPRQGYRPSYLFTQDGLTDALVPLAGFVQTILVHERMVQVGRSLNQFSAFAFGALSGLPEDQAKISDLPFSFPYTTDIPRQYREALRHHLKGNHLSPLDIVRLQTPLCITDTVRPDRSLELVLSEILVWAKELGVEKETRAGIHVLAFAPPSAPPVNLAHLASEVRVIPISSELFDYLNTHSYKVQENFTPEFWTAHESGGEPLNFGGRMHERGWVELFGLVQKGRETMAGRDSICTLTTAARSLWNTSKNH